MNHNPFKLFAKITYIITLLLIIISCKNQVNEEQTTILNYKNNNIEYQVKESLSKSNSNDIEQCEKFLEYSNDTNGFKVNGATLGDLYSIIYSINPSKVELLDKKALFYSVVYKGEKDDAVLDDLFKQILNKRKLGISLTNRKIDLTVLSLENSKKINEYLSVDAIESEIIYNEDKYICKNVNLEIFVKVLNNLFPNEFSYKGNLNDNYNLEIPIGLSKVEMIKYLYETYDINHNTELVSIEIYQLGKKNK